MRVLVTSEKDLASITIRTTLIDDFGFEKTDNTFDGNPIWAFDRNTLLVTSSKDLIYTDHLEQHFDAEAFIFCSRHRAKSGKPALLTHSTGNLGPEARFGGDPNELSVSTASLVSTALRVLKQQRDENDLNEFDVTMEATHHGPTSLKAPLIFIELGSDETYWRHKGGAHAVAMAAVECSKTPFAENAFIGIGGTHYVSKFNKMVLNDDAIFGHIAPKYALEGLNRIVAKQMVERTHERVEAAVIDWKGTNSTQRDHVIPLMEDVGLGVIRARDI